MKVCILKCPYCTYVCVKFIRKVLRFERCSLSVCLVELLDMLVSNKLRTFYDVYYSVCIQCDLRFTGDLMVPQRGMKYILT